MDLKENKKETKNEYDSLKKYNWDPLKNGAWNLEKPSYGTIKRIKKDFMSILEDPLPGIFVMPDDSDLTILNALIVGPVDTPYEGGLFQLLIRFPPNYPFDPPKIKNMTTSGETVRFNPNFYANGKICLSIIGTWMGPGWVPAQTLSSVLISIQSLLNSNPYHNEPGFHKERKPGDSKMYNSMILHQKLKVSVCENLEKENIYPECIKIVMKKTFLQYYDYFKEECEANKHLDDKIIIDPLFGDKYGTFTFAKILQRMDALKLKFESEPSEATVEKSFKSDDSDHLEGTWKESDSDFFLD